MNFDLDDPLEGLLSDGSNDSLFGNEGAKKPAAKSTKPTNKMEDLFGIKGAEQTKAPATSAKPTEQQAGPASLDYTKPLTSSLHQPSSLSSVQGKKLDTPVKKKESVAAPPPAKPSTPQRKEISFDDGDLLSDLGFDPKKPKSTKTSILDDILGGSLVGSTKEIPAKSVLAKPRQSLTTSAGGDSGAAGKPISRQSTDASENPAPEGGGTGVMGSYAPSGAAAAGSAPPRRGGRRQSSISTLNDPLGLFAPAGDEKAGRRESKQLTKKAGADWLGLNDDASTVETDPVPPIAIIPTVQAPEKPTSNVPELAPNPKRQEVPAEIPAPITTKQDSSTPLQTAVKPVTPAVEPTVTVPAIPNPDPAFSQTLQLVEAEAQSALAAMQQQEFQLSMAGQLKSQEQLLYDMQQKQQAVLKRQEAQFNELLQKQMQRHSALEEVLTRQQQRINANIQLIMSQPAATGTVGPILQESALEKNTSGSNEEQGDPLSRVELQTDVKRLEMEKLRLEDLLSNLTANHEQELTLLEASYRKQASFLEDSMRIMEVRLRNDAKQMEESYRTKIEALEQEKLQLASAHHERIRELEESHRGAMEKMKQSYDDSLEQLRQDHREMIATVRESKLLEFAAVQDNQSYLQVLKSASTYLETASGDIQQLRDALQEQVEFSQKERELQLRAREKQVEDQQRLLERTRNAAAEENVRMLNLIEALESKVTEMTKASAEERWEYQQKSAKLEAERQGLEKEKQFHRERCQREEERIAELKQTALEEHARLMARVNQERESLLEEKVKLETMAQLSAKCQPSIVGGGGASRVEVEAALKVAEEAARQADTEKGRYLQLQRQFEAKRRELMTRESKQREVTDELECAIERARQRERNAENVLRGLRRAEQNMQLKAQLVQRQFREVSEREDRLAREKIEFSKERLELQAARHKLQQTRCSLCKIGEKSQEIAGDLLTTANTDSVADDLKLEANFAELQGRHDTAGLKLDQLLLGSDVDQQLKLFLEQTRVDNLDLNELERPDGLDGDMNHQLRLDTLFPHSRYDEERNEDGDR